MKNLLFAGLIALLVLPGCESTDTREEDQEDIRVVSWKSVTMSPANDSDVPAEFKESFATDAFLLSLRETEEDSTLDSVFYIPEKMHGLFYNGLVHLYHAVQYPERDSVFSNNSIHPWLWYTSTGILVIGDTTVSWVNNLYRGTLPTGNTYVDSLFEKYNIEIHNAPSTFLVELRIHETNVNLHGLISALKKQPGIQIAEANGISIFPGHHPSDITVQIKNTWITYKFIPSGYLNSKVKPSYEFDVNYKGTVVAVRKK